MYTSQNPHSIRNNVDILGWYYFADTKIVKEKVYSEFLNESEVSSFSTEDIFERVYKHAMIQ